MADTLRDYFKSVGKHDLLSREQEALLAQQIEAGDKSARDLFIQSNLRLAISIAKRYMNKGCSFEDLVQESNIGLIKAVDRFDWRRGFKFSTYASWWIRQSVRRHVTDQSCNIRMPSSANAFYYRAKMMIQDYTAEFGSPPTDEEVASFMGVSTSKYSTLMNTYRGTVSLDSTAYSSDEDGPQLHETLADSNQLDPNEVMDHEKVIMIVRQALSTLTPREEKVLRLRFGLTEEKDDDAKFPISQEEIAALNARCEGV